MLQQKTPPRLPCIPLGVAQIRTELVANAWSAGFWIVLSAMAATTAMTAAAMQAVMKTRMVEPSGNLDSSGHI